MRRRHRIALGALGVAAAVAVVRALIVLGAASEGPLSAALHSVGRGVSALESRVARRLRGPGRSAELGWLEPMRSSAVALAFPDTLLLGAYDDGLPSSLEGVLALEEMLGARFALVPVYTAWGDLPEHAFPRRLAEAIHELGSIPVVTWEPWLTTFENRLHPHLPLREGRDRDGLAAVARGDYDHYVDAWASEAARFGHPLLLRFAHEMNDPYRYPWGPQNNEPQAFIDAWRHVVDRFRAVGADNVVWVWSPHVAYEGYEAYWPGDPWVDWVGAAALNYGTVAYWSRWWSFEEIFGRHAAFLEGFGKPIIIAELGTLSVGGDRAAWYRDALTDIERRHPRVKALVFFHVSSDATVTRQALDWSFEEDTAVLGAVREALHEADRPAVAPSRARPRPGGGP